MDYADVVEHYGTCARAARALGLRRQTVHRWKEIGITFEKQFIIQMKTKGKLKAQLPVELRGRKQAA